MNFDQNNILTTKPFVFYFSFYHTDNEITKAFVVNEQGMHRLLKGEYTVRYNELYKANPTDERISPFNIFLNDYYDRYGAEIENEFGTHDFISSPVDAVDAIGQYTSEVELDLAEACINRHRDVFVALAGADCVSCIVDLPHTLDTDLDFYNEIINSLHV